MEAADGRPIWVPLSGGRDSRLIVCKLVEAGYDNVQTFSYGPRGNWDARIARDVAERLGLPWRFVPTGRHEARRFYGSPERRAYWAYADGHCSLPSSQDLLPIMKLRADDAMPDDAVVVNGQTGDFLTGGHVPASLMTDEADSETLIEGIVAKHLSLWKSLKTESNLQRVTGRIRDKLGLPGAENAEVLGRDRAVALYQAWGAKRTPGQVRGQRPADLRLPRSALAPAVVGRRVHGVLAGYATGRPVPAAAVLRLSGPLEFPRPVRRLRTSGLGVEPGDDGRDSASFLDDAPAFGAAPARQLVRLFEILRQVRDALRLLPLSPFRPPCPRFAPGAAPCMWSPG